MAVSDKQMRELVERFLTWPLPESVCADPCATMNGYPRRTGTNLLTFEQAEAMLKHVLADMLREVAIGDDAREIMAGLLRQTAIALKGPEPPLTSWGWDDLPALAAAARARLAVVDGAPVGYVMERGGTLLTISTEPRGAYTWAFERVRLVPVEGGGNG